MPIGQKLDMIKKKIQIWNQLTKVSLNRAPNPRQQKKSSKLLPSVINSFSATGDTGRQPPPPSALTSGDLS